MCCVCMWGGGGGGAGCQILVMFPKGGSFISEQFLLSLFTYSSAVCETV